MVNYVMKKHAIPFTSLLLILGIIVCAFRTEAQKASLQLYSTGQDTIAVAILPFTAAGEEKLASTSTSPEDIIARDLSFTGKFRVLRTSKIDTQLFRSQRIALVIDGEYTRNDEHISLQCNVHDASSIELLLGKKYRGDITHLRTMAHRFSNKVVRTLLGKKGLFESAIVFVKEYEKEKHLYMMDYDGFRVKKIFATPTTNIFPAFADTTSLLWTSYLRGKPDIYRGSLESGNADILFYSRGVDVSPDVNMLTGQVAFSSSRGGNLDIYRAPVNGGRPRKLTDSYSIETSPSWSPNGYHIAFTSDRSGTPQIYIMDKDGANIKRLTFKGNYQDSPDWAPSGTHIAYASLQDNKFDIWTIKPDGSEAKKITSCAGNNEYPAWSPDGNHIAFVSTRGTQSDIYTIKKDGTNLRRITDSHNARMPDWLRFSP